jgi:hypothetical protein
MEGEKVTLKTLTRVFELAPVEKDHLLAQKLGVEEYMRFHVDNYTNKDSVYADVLKCVDLFKSVRAGIEPMEIEGFLDFVKTQPKEVKIRIIQHGQKIQEELLIK